MERSLAEEVVASLPGSGVTYRYFKDRYAVQLLAYAAAQGRRLPELKRGYLAPLFQKPTVRALLGARGSHDVDWSVLDSYFPSPTEDYEVTLGLWGSERDWRWNQTSRPGFNVVVQLNFPVAHDRAYRRYVAPRERHPFARSCHPINAEGLHTLAWSRLDIDLEHREALIEEIQSDWIREAELAAGDALKTLIDGRIHPPWWLDDTGCDAHQLFRYVEFVLAPHRRLWSQAVLSASLWLLRERLNVRHVYMHTSETGRALKWMEADPPPWSLYEQVPRSFCFQRVEGFPRFLESSRGRGRRLPRCEFWHMRV